MLAKECSRPTGLCSSARRSILSCQANSSRRTLIETERNRERIEFLGKKKGPFGPIPTLRVPGKPLACIQAIPSVRRLGFWPSGAGYLTPSVQRSMMNYRLGKLLVNTFQVARSSNREARASHGSSAQKSNARISPRVRGRTRHRRLSRDNGKTPLSPVFPPTRDLSGARALGRLTGAGAARCPHPRRQRWKSGSPHLR